MKQQQQAHDKHNGDFLRFLVADIFHGCVAKQFDNAEKGRAIKPAKL